MSIQIPAHLLDTATLFLAASLVGHSVIMVLSLLYPKWIRKFENMPGLVVYVVAALLAGKYHQQNAMLCIGLVSLGFGVVHFLAKLFPNFRQSWHVFVANIGLHTLILILWSFVLLQLISSNLSFPVLVVPLYLASLTIVFAFSFSLLCQVTTEFLDLYRVHFVRRPNLQKLAQSKNHPKVSLHVPCFAEPPDIVKTTLSALSKLNYPNFEVVVVDNNTKDPNLWKPVEDFCQRLGSRFRFYHVDPLPGAKGGALNYAMEKTAIDAEIIGIVDADYVCEPSFISNLISEFDDPRISYVQTPHDYREYSSSTFRSCCYWEYRYKHYLVYSGMNEWDASLITGTMCLVRRSALIEVGGWSEECLCEDSELSLRLGAAGYMGQYVRETNGRGLIPETFASYQAQRFRWCAGTLQHILMHWRLFIPKALGGTNQIPELKKFIGLIDRLGLSFGLIGYLSLPVIILVSMDLALLQRKVDVPPTLLILLVSIILQKWTYSWLRSQLLGRSFNEAIRAHIADQSLCHVRVVALIKIFLSSRALRWERTNKFKAQPQGWKSLRNVLPETGLSISAFLVGSLFLWHANFFPMDVLALVGLGTILQGYSWFCAPLMVLFQEIDLAKSKRVESAERVNGGAIDNRFQDYSIEIGR